MLAAVKRWPQIRAGVLAVVIGFGLVEGCPLPSPEHTPAWEKDFVEPIRGVQRVVLRPVAWIEPTVRVSQRWAVYQAPSRDRFRLWIEGRDGRGRWQVLFRGRAACGIRRASRPASTRHSRAG